MLLHRTIILRCPLIFVGLDPSRSRIDDGFCVGYQRWNGLLRDADPFDLQALEWLGVRGAHEWLRGQVKHQVGRKLSDDCLKRLHVSKIALGLLIKREALEKFVRVWFGGRGETYSGDRCSELLQPQRQPTALEPSLACD